MKNKLKKFLESIHVNTKEDAKGFSIFCASLLFGLFGLGGLSFISWKIPLTIIVMFSGLVGLWLLVYKSILKLIDK